MRRPPPLPVPPEPEAKSAPAVSAHNRRNNASAPTAPRDPVAPSDGEQPDDESVPEQPAAEVRADLTARDVWRAARARRKTLRAEIRRFTQRSRRRRIIWLAAIGAVVLLIGGSVATAYSPLFAVEKVTIVGTTTLDPDALETALGDQIGTPLALVSESDIKAALVAFPLIETYALEAKPPHELAVRIVERTPIGVVESDAGFTLVDAAGVTLATTSTQPEGQPLLRVSGGIDTDAFESVGLVVRSLPAEVRSAVTEVTASTLDDVTLKLSSGLTVVWGSAELSVEKAHSLSGAMTANPNARSIDVSSPEVIVAG